MAIKGAVAGCVKTRDGTWVMEWMPIESVAGVASKGRVYLSAKTALAQKLGRVCGGEAVARRKGIFIEAISPDGLELLEKIQTLIGTVNAARLGEQST